MSDLWTEIKIEIFDSVNTEKGVNHERENE